MKPILASVSAIWDTKLHMLEKKEGDTMIFLLITLVVIYIFLEELSRGADIWDLAAARQKRRSRKK